MQKKPITFSSIAQRKSFIKKNTEFSTIEAFVQSLIDDERTEFTGEEMLLFAAAHQMSFTKVREQLEEYGMKLKVRQIERRIRGFRTSSNDRWFAKEY